MIDEFKQSKKLHAVGDEVIYGNGSRGVITSIVVINDPPVHTVLYAIDDSSTCTFNNQISLNITQQNKQIDEMSDT